MLMTDRGVTTGDVKNELTVSSRVGRQNVDGRHDHGVFGARLAAMFHISDNRLAMKLFGSRTALDRERRRHRQLDQWIVHPCSNFRLLTITV